MNRGNPRVGKTSRPSASGAGVAACAKPEAGPETRLPKRSDPRAAADLAFACSESPLLRPLGPAEPADGVGLDADAFALLAFMGC